MGSESNITLILTRPYDDNLELARQIQQFGWKVVNFPALAITAVDEALLKHRLIQLHEFDVAIFLSKNAATYVAPSWPDSSLNPKVIAIGPATLQVLTEFQIPVAFCPEDQFNSEGLLSLPILGNIHNAKIVIFKGKGGRNLLANTLTERGAQVTEVIVYERGLSQSNPMLLEQLFNSRQYIVFVVLSNETLQNLHTLFARTKLYSAFMESYFLVGSSRIAQFALSLHHPADKIIEATSPIQDAILEKLIAWYSKITIPQG